MKKGQKKHSEKCAAGIVKTFLGKVFFPKKKTRASRGSRKDLLGGVLGKRNFSGQRGEGDGREIAVEGKPSRDQKNAEKGED